MVRFFSIHRDPCNGQHLHLTYTSERPTLAAACQEMAERLNQHSAAPLFYDFGTGDNDLRRLDLLPCWLPAPAVAGAAPNPGN